MRSASRSMVSASLWTAHARFPPSTVSRFDRDASSTGRERRVGGGDRPICVVGVREGTRGYSPLLHACHRLGRLF
jgi:hypothetical protein